MAIRTLVISPCYNENKNITRLIDGVLARAAGADVLIIDDNSPDGTAIAVSEIIASEPRVRLMKRPNKMGLGTAYLDGFEWAVKNGYDRIVTMDADLSHSPAYIPMLLDTLNGADIVIGSRYVEGGGIEGWPLTRRLLSRTGNLYARFITGIPVRDCTSGFLAIKADIVKEFVKDRISSEGYAFLIESKHRAWKKGYAIKEVPIVFVDRTAGRSKISRKIILEALALCLKLRNG